MKFYFDTGKNEDLLLTFNPDDDPQKSIYDLCYGLSVMYTEFCVQLGLDEEDARNLLSVCQSFMTKNVEEYISNGILEQDDESDEADGVSDEDLDALKKSMTAAGFSEEEIQNITALVKDAGIDGALDVLRGIGREVCDDWTEFEKGVEDFISSRTPDTDDEDDAEGVSDEKIDELTQGMRAAGFSDEEISNIVDLVQDAGSMEGALNILIGIAKDAGIDLPDFDDVHILEDAEDDNLCSKEQMKKEATSRLEQLVNKFSLNPNVAKYWEKDGQLYYSYLTGGGFVGSVDKIDYDPKNIAVVKQFEAEYGSMVYHAIEDKGTLILLSVSNDPDEWEYERLEDNVIMAYVHNFEYPDQSEFGDVALNAWQGALVRTRWRISYED